MQDLGKADHTGFECSEAVFPPPLLLRWAGDGRMPTIAVAGDPPGDAGTERFAAAALTAVGLGIREARLLGHCCVGTQHLILGTLRSDRGLGAEALRSLGITHLEARSFVRESPITHARRRERDTPFTERCTDAFGFALEEARQAGEDRAGPEHLLLGALRDGVGSASYLLLRFGADLPLVRSQLQRLRRRPSPQGSEGPGGGNGQGSKL